MIDRITEQPFCQTRVSGSTFVNADCFDVFPFIEDKSIDAIICDLPYGTTACKWDSILPFDKLWKEYKRIIKDDGAIVLFGSEPFSTELRHSNLEMYKYDWIWEKNTCGNFMAAKYKPLKYCELISVFSFGSVNTKGGKGGGKTERPHMKYLPQGVVLSDKTITRKSKLPTTGINRWNKLSNSSFKSSGSNYPKDILRFSGVDRKNRLHPTQKPVQLLEYLIKTYTSEGDTVLDNCMGSGSTGVACINTERKFIGIELDDNYFDIATKRILGEEFV